jgi:hypothetical protein
MYQSRGSCLQHSAGPKEVRAYLGLDLTLSHDATSDFAIGTANLWKLGSGSELLVLLAKYFEEIFGDLMAFKRIA